MHAPTVRILSTGSEILQGLYTDTNAQGLAQRLLEAGFRVIAHAAAPDDQKLIRETIEFASERCDLVVMTGGLGPTEDDVNRDVIAELYGLALEFDATSEQMMRKRFYSRGVPMPERNRVQAMIPVGAVILHNHWGTAPGFLVPAQAGRGALLALPGPRTEWFPMLGEALKPGGVIDAAFPARPVQDVHTLHMALTPESTLNEVLRDLFAPSNGVELTILASRGIIRLRIVGTGNDRASLASAIQERRDEIIRRIGSEIVFAEGPDSVGLAEALIRTLREREETVALSESCTGGWVAKSLTDVGGASDVFGCGWVTYANSAKVRDLGVDAALLEREGAVSEATARAMAEGARTRSGATWALAVTGIAGPTGGSATKPVGLVWFAIAGPSGTKAFQRIFRGDRDSIRHWAVNQALESIRRTALGIPLEQYLGGANPRFLDETKS
jgi:nicotinamide-nucleotide amidase